MKLNYDLNDLNRRRRIQERLRFIKNRIRDSVAELSFARGKVPALPKGQLMPPAWALAAARISWEKGFAHLRTLRVDEKDKTLGDAAELFGIYRRLVSYVQNPPVQVRGEEKRDAGLITLRKSAARHVSRRFLNFIERIERKFHSGIQIPTEEQLIEWATRYEKGVTGFFTSDSQVESLRTKEARIYYLLWLFWPKLLHQFSTGSIHTWLRVEHGETEISDSTVEAVVTQLRKDVGPLELERMQP
jgi:hypothetical protein